MIIISSMLALLVGAALGVLGGGGSILMLPILVYVVGVAPLLAIPLSLLVVGTTSAAALLPHARSGNVHWRQGLLFGSAGMIGAYAGGRLSPLLPSWLLLTGFAVLMVVTAVSMLRGNLERPCERRAQLPRALLQGLVVGVVSGLIGAGGGFLVVPTLVLLCGMTMRRAVGTSLLVIALQSLAGFAAHLHHAELDWSLAASTAVASVVGSLLGAHWSLRIAQAKLRRWFAWLVLALGTFVLLKQLAPLFAHSQHALLLPLVGGALIGAAAAIFWVLQGRMAGISGIVGGLFVARSGDRGWRALFLLGLLVGGALMARLRPSAFGPSPVSLGLLVASGLLVGIGTTLANGCTSGHGVCGVSRLSSRSLAATASFMSAGLFVVYLVRHVFGAHG